MAKKFPKTILVTRNENGTDDPYLGVVEGGIEYLDPDIVDGQVATYELKKVERLQITKTLVKK